MKENMRKRPSQRAGFRRFTHKTSRNTSDLTQKRGHSFIARNMIIPRMDCKYIILI